MYVCMYTYKQDLRILPHLLHNYLLIANVLGNQLHRYSNLSTYCFKLRIYVYSIQIGVTYV